MNVEKITIASEINESAPELKEQILKRFQHGEVKVEYVKHEQFKRLTEDSAAIIRTGETTPSPILSSRPALRFDICYSVALSVCL